MEVVAAAASEIWRQEVPEVKVSVGPGGTFANVFMVQNNEAQMGTIPGNAAYDGWVQEPPFDKKTDNLRGMMALYPNVFQIWALPQSEISTITDLIGKRVGTSQPDSGGYLASVKIFDVYGFSFDDIVKARGQVMPLGWGAAVGGLKDRRIDVLTWTTTYPAPAIVDAMMTQDLDVIGLDQDKIDEFMGKYPGFIRITIPAGTYKGQEDDVYTFGSPVSLIIHKDLPEDLVYRMTKALWERRSRLGDTHALLKGMSLENVAHGMMVPLHPGAKRFYQEIGAVLDPIDQD